MRSNTRGLCENAETVKNCASAAELLQRESAYLRIDRPGCSTRRAEGWVQWSVGAKARRPPSEFLDHGGNQRRGAPRPVHPRSGLRYLGQTAIRPRAVRSTGRSPSRLLGARWSSPSKYRRHRPTRPSKTRVPASPGGTTSRPHSAPIGSDAPDRQRRPIRGRRSRAVRRGHGDVRAGVADRAA